MQYKLLFALFCFFMTYIYNTNYLSASNTKEEKNEPAFYFDKYSTPWVDSVFQSLSMEERIAQLLMIRVHTEHDIIEEPHITDFIMMHLVKDEGKNYYNDIIKTIEKYNIGGVAFFSGTPKHQVKVTNKLQSHASTPLLTAMDAEWGPGMRLKNTPSFPYQMTLGAIQDNKLIYEMGLEIARQLKRMGVHINFAPVADVNSNPLNPVINFRSFGECKFNVTNKSLAYMKGMQDWGIIANAKHFPGHGDTSTDSHYTLPIIKHNHDHIESIHLFPFKHLINNGLKSIMTAHLNIPAYDRTKNLASTLSENVVTGLLQNDMGFEGLIITDALDMRGVSDYFQSGELELKALKAGNDILLLPEDVPAAISTIKQAIKNGELSEHYVNNKCKKVLFYKEMAGLNNYKPTSYYNLHNDINSQKAELLKKKLIENAITLVKNQNDLVPVKDIGNKSIASLSIGADSINAFQKYLSGYYSVNSYSVCRDLKSSETKELIKDLSHYNTIIISLHNNSLSAALKYGITDKINSFITDISENNNVILNLFANPYILNFITNTENIESIIISYQDGKYYETSSAQVIFGSLPAKGKLPISANPYFPIGTGINTHSIIRVSSSSPEEKKNIAPVLSQNIDSIVKSGINKKAYPGAQVVVIKNGNVIINNSYGHHAYDKKNKVHSSDIYDLASLTKIASTTAAIMHLKDKGLIDIDNNIADYLPWLKNSNLEGIIIRDIMTHQGQLQSWIPFYLETIDDGILNPLIYNDSHSDEYPVKVAKNLFIHKDYRDTLFKQIMEAPLSNTKDYLYSDLGFILLAEIVKELSGISIDKYMSKNFYIPMGLESMTYNPLEKFDSSRIVASENDTFFRKQLLHGYVNDPGAAMLGGISGHAGLFSNALDMAIMMQMFLQGGSYGGRQYISKEIIDEFTKTQFPENNNRRGIGFDKPALEKNNGPTCENASPQSFGHSGFTGTYAWADPKKNLVYVFLSNRVYPCSSNRKLIKNNIRTNIQQAIYEAIIVTKHSSFKKY